MNAAPRFDQPAVSHGFLNRRSEVRILSGAFSICLQRISLRQSRSLPLDGRKRLGRAGARGRGYASAPVAQSRTGSGSAIDSGAAGGGGSRSTRARVLPTERNGGIGIVLALVLVMVLLRSSNGERLSGETARRSRAVAELNVAPDAAAVHRLAQELFDKEADIAPDVLSGQMLHLPPCSATTQTTRWGRAQYLPNSPCSALIMMVSPWRLPWVDDDPGMRRWQLDPARYHGVMQRSP